MTTYPVKMQIIPVAKKKEKSDFMNMIRNRSQTLLGGPDAKRGPLKFLTLVRGGPEKNTTDFPLKIEFTCFSMGLTRNFHGKKGGGGLNFFCDLKGGGLENVFCDKYFCNRPPLQVFVNGP